MFVASFFTTLIVKPIFNLLVLIYALLPGHNFGLAIILFTILVRILMWPLVKKQLHQAKAMRELQPEMKRIKKAAKGDRQKESQMLMELYKEREISPFGSIGTLLVQFAILIGLYIGLRRVVDNPKQIIDFSYTALHHLPWLQTLAGDVHRFDETLLGVVDLTKPALQNGNFYFPALILVALSAFAQFKQSAQIMPKPEDGRGLRTILKEANSGKVADQAEVSQALNRQMIFLVPAMVFLFTLNLPSALSLYWLTGAIVAIFQQGRVLKQDELELMATTNGPNEVGVVAEAVETVGRTTKVYRSKSRKSEVLEGEVIESTSTPKPKTKKKPTKTAKKRRK